MDPFMFQSLMGGFGQQQQPQQQQPPPNSITALLAQMQGLQAPQPMGFNQMPAEAQAPTRRMGLLTLAAALANGGTGQIGTALANSAAAGEQMRQRAADDYYHQQRQQYDDQFQGLSGQVRLAQMQEEEHRRQADQAR